MHILLLILKFIGILILVVLGFLLTLFLLVLFVPIRYRIDGEKESQGNLKGKVRLNWLMHILSIHILADEEISADIKIFGRPVFLKKSKEDFKAKKEDKKVSKHKKREKNTNHSNRKKKEEGVQTKHKNPKDESTVFIQESKTEEKEVQTEELKEIVPVDIKEKKKVKEQPPQQKEKKKKNIVYKIRKKMIWFWHEAKKIYNQILSFLQRLKYHWTEWLDKKEILIQAWHNKENQRGIHFVWESTKRLLQHIAPKKWTGYIHFGMDNPESTGKILGLIGIFGGIIGILPEIQPDFEKKIFEGKVMLKGRIYSFYLIQLLIQIWKKKEVHKLINNIKKVWEELSWQKTI